MKKTLSLLYALLLAGVLPDPAARAADYTNSIGMAFKDIPAGRFYMGSCWLSEADREMNKKRKTIGLPPRDVDCPSGVDDEAYDDETPQHEVHIRRRFRMGVHEVTQGQFKQYITAAGRDDLLTDEFIAGNGNGDRAPVAWVSRDDAQGFIGWLNKKEGTQAYRLPSEAEWEYAARAGTTTRYDWGNKIGRNRANCSGCGSEWDNKRPAPVGSFEPNGFGLYDMHGNVWEWVADCYGDYEDAPTDGSTRTSGCVSDSAVVRGGALKRSQVEKRLGGGGNTVSLQARAQVCLHCGARLYTEAVGKSFAVIRDKPRKKAFSHFKPPGQSFTVEKNWSSEAIRPAS